MKKGMEIHPLALAGAAVLVLFIIYFSTTFYREKIMKVGGVIGAEELRLARQACKAQGDRFQLEQRPQNQWDTDRDGYPNSCDFCYGQTEGIGNDDVDDDQDGIPQECDDDDTRPRRAGATLQSICDASNGTWDAGRERCVLRSSP